MPKVPSNDHRDSVAITCSRITGYYCEVISSYTGLWYFTPGCIHRPILSVPSAPHPDYLRALYLLFTPTV